jgi:hypothetical protein
MRTDHFVTNEIKQRRRKRNGENNHLCIAQKSFTESSAVAESSAESVMVLPLEPANETDHMGRILWMLRKYFHSTMDKVYIP